VVVELGLAFFISARAASMAPPAAAGLFYSALNGVTLSVILVAYTGESIATAFLVTAGTMH
jgi:FtsH-binding integral membrane protein